MFRLLWRAKCRLNKEKLWNKNEKQEDFRRRWWRNWSMQMTWSISSTSWRKKAVTCTSAIFLLLLMHTNDDTVRQFWASNPASFPLEISLDSLQCYHQNKKGLPLSTAEISFFPPSGRQHHRISSKWLEMETGPFGFALGFDKEMWSTSCRGEKKDK